MVDGISTSNCKGFCKPMYFEPLFSLLHQLLSGDHWPIVGNIAIAKERHRKHVEDLAKREWQ